MATLTRAGRADALRREVGLSRAETAGIVEDVIEAIVESLSAGEEVKIAGFGSFVPRDRGPRMGRNPKTGEEAPIAARRAVAFRPSRILRDRIDAALSAAPDGA